MSRLTDLLGRAQRSFTNATTAIMNAGSSLKDKASKMIGSFVAKAAVKAVTEDLSHTVGPILNSAMMAAESKLKKSMMDLGESVGKIATTAIEQATAAGSNQIDTTLGNIGKKYNAFLNVFKEEIDALKQSDDSESKKLGIGLAEILYNKLTDLGDACFQAKKLSLGAFQSESSAAINKAKPRIQEELGNAFVDLCLTPLINFLKSIAFTIFKGLFSSMTQVSTQQIETTATSDKEAPVDPTTDVIDASTGMGMF